MMASTAGAAPSTRIGPLQIAPRRQIGRAREAIERWLEAERDQLPLWLPVALGAGITIWYVLPDPRSWLVAMLALVAAAFVCLAIGRGGRAGRILAVGALAAALGVGLIWWRAERVAAPILTRPAIVTFTARVIGLDTLPARGLVRLTLAPASVEPNKGKPARPLPPTIRVNLQEADVPMGLDEGATVKLGARLMPPPSASVPGAYDYGQVAWFGGLGATGRGFAPVTIVKPGAANENGLRAKLTRHIEGELPGSAGGIAAALVTGDEGAITLDDSNAMRRSGLAHLLSVSGLHITVVVAGVMLVTMKLLALWPWLALRFRLPLIAAGAGAAAAIGYTLLTGSQVPTIRSCVAALMVLAAIALGREAVTLRLVATGALVVLLFVPEALAGPSFQLSFAAVTAIIALHEHPRIRDWFGGRDEPRLRKMGRELGSLLLTGFVVELALIPIGLYHFHKAGVYGAVANIVAIPLTTFVIMPFEALALVFDVAGIGAPFWWLTGKAMALLLWIAHTTGDAPGAVAPLPAMPDAAFGLMIAGGLWIALWRTKWRRLGAIPVVIGALWALLTPAPDLLITGDGRHVAFRLPDGRLALLRERTGEYTQDMMAENAGIDGVPMLIDDQPEARCSRDTCIVTLQAGDRAWRILATRSLYMIDRDALMKACESVDIAISERRLPRACTPRWLKLDAPMLVKTGGVAITLAYPHVTTVNDPADQHEWAVAARSALLPKAHGKHRRRSSQL